MTKYLSGRSKRISQSGLTNDRYQYLGLNQAEPNLGDPSAIGPTIPVGQQYQVISVINNPGLRYWIPVGGGLIPGSISIFDEGTITPVGGLSSITQLNFVGAAVSAKGYLNPNGSPGIAVTITVFSPGSQGQVIFNNNNDFKGASSLFYDNSTNYVGVGTTTGVPTQELQVNGNLRLTGTIYDYNNRPGNISNILVKNNFGGLTWVDQNTIRAGAGGTITNIQYHNNAGLVDGASNFVFDYTNSRVGIGSTLPTYLFDVLGYSKFTGQTEIDYLNVTGIATASQLKVENLTTTKDLNVTGYSTFASYIDANGGAYIDNIQIGITNDNTIDTTTGDLTIGSVGGTTFINNNNLTVTSGITSVGFITATTGFIGILTANILNIVQTKLTNLEVTGIATIGTLRVGGLTTTRYLDVIGITTTDSLNVTNGATTKNLKVTGIATFEQQVNITNLSVTGVGTFDNIKLDTNTVYTTTGNLLLDSSGGTTQIDDKLYVTDVTQSTDKDSGSIVTEGGVGIEKNLNVGGQLSIVGITTLASSGGITTTGGDLYVGGTLYVKTNFSFNDISARTGTFTDWLKTKDFYASGISTLASLGVTGLTTTRNLKVIGISTFDDYIDANGGAYIDNIQIGITNDNTINTSSGNITIGSAGGTTTLSDGSLSVTGAASFNGNVTLGNDASDVVSFTSKVNSSILPSTTGLDLGSTGNKWNKVYAASFDGQFIGNADSATYATKSGIATNLGSGTIYQIPYQSAPDTTSFISTTGATTGQLLQYNTNLAPSWTNATGLTVGYANTAGIATYANTAGIATYATKAGIATNLGSGTIYQIPYQSAPDTTAFISTTSAVQGYLLQYNTNLAPSWTNATGLTIGYANTAGIATYATKAGIATYATKAGIATNLGSGTIYQIPYQSAPDTTAFISTTGATTGQLLQYNSNSAPSWTNATGLTIGYANTAGIATYANTAGYAGSITVSSDSSNLTRYIPFVDTTSGVTTVRTNSSLTYNPSTSILTTNNLIVSGLSSLTNLTISGITTIGDASSDTIYFNSRVGTGITPSSPGVYDLGNSTNKWNDIYANKLYVSTITGNLSGAASSITVYPDSTNATRYLPFVDSTSGVTSIRTNSTLVYNPSGIGSVGIATNNPKASLDVGSGNIYASYGDVHINGSVFINNTRTNGGGFWSNGGFDGSLDVNCLTVGGSVGFAVKYPGGSSGSFGSPNVGSMYRVVTARWNTGLSTGVFGIGTTTPTVELQLSPTASISNVGTSTTLADYYGATLTVAQFYHKNNNGSYLRIKATRNNVGTSWTTASTKLVNVTDTIEQAYIEFNPYNTVNNTETGIAFGTNTTEFARFLANGSLCINTTYTNAKFEVKGNGFADEYPEISVSGYGAFELHNRLGNGNYNSIVQTDDKGIIFHNGSADTGNFVIAPWSNSVAGIRIATSGNVGIGVSIPTSRLHVGGNITCNQISPNTTNAYSCGTNGAVWSAVWVNGGVVSGSDQRDKTNITSSDLGLNFIQKLNPVSYKWIVGGNEVITDENGIEVGITSHPGKRTHYGLLSQEVKTAFDECGAEDFAGWILTDTTDSDSRQALRYEQFISPMIKAIQEQQETINQLTTTVNSLLERIELLENPL